MVFIRTEYASSSARSEVGFEGKICAVLAMQVSPTLKRGNPREKIFAVSTFLRGSYLYAILTSS